jgi:predicted RNA binding protein YcfA (HicA-like mRNA interferase family)
VRLPRDLDGRDLAKALRQFGYEISRQTGSHIRLTTHAGGEHHLTIPDHNPLRVGTLAAILLLEPALNDSYAAVKANTWEWTPKVAEPSIPEQASRT